MDKQKDFEKGWEEYKKKTAKDIEQMAKLSGGCDYPHRNCDDCWCKNSFECSAYYYCKSLYGKGVRKIPENAVVLTPAERDEEMREIRQDVIERMQATRKETAEKFAERLKEVISDICFNVGTVGFDGYQSCSAVNPNTVIERIDEIFEEITEKAVE